VAITTKATSNKALKAPTIGLTARALDVAALLAWGWLCSVGTVPRSRSASARFRASRM
jgi:hypothetical protein